MILGPANSTSHSSKNKDLSRALLVRVGLGMLFLLGKIMLEMGLGIHIWERAPLGSFSAVLSCLSSVEPSGPSPQYLSKLIGI